MNINILEYLTGGLQINTKNSEKSNTTAAMYSPY